MDSFCPSVLARIAEVPNARAAVCEDAAPRVAILAIAWRRAMSTVWCLTRTFREVARDGLCRERTADVRRGLRKLLKTEDILVPIGSIEFRFNSPSI